MSWPKSEDGKLIGGAIFRRIEIDDRITPDLKTCLFCSVSSSKDNDYTAYSYRIPLQDLGDGFEQCPACKRIYILKDL